MKYRILMSSAAVIPLVALTACAGAGSAPTTSSPPKAIAWSDCDSLVGEANALYEQIGMPLAPETTDRLECASVQAPVDYRNPDGQKLDIQITRLPAIDQEEGIVFTNPGGPGLEGRTLPLMLAQSSMAALNKTRTLIGIDVRGTGDPAFACNEADELEAPTEDPVTKETAAAYATQIAKTNASCVAANPAFYANLTTENAARDLDRIREALGVRTVSYFGMSWGTELGLAYRSAFGKHVDRMLLDSVVDIRGDATSTLDDIVAATESFSQQEDAPHEGLAAAAFTFQVSFTGTAYTCNAHTGASDFEQQWADYQRRASTYPRTGAERPAHPISAPGVAGVTQCIDWPLPAKPTVMKHDDGSIQLVAHQTETVTPAVWARNAQSTIGGHLFELPDGNHAGLSSSDKAPAAVAYLTTGAYIE